MSTLSGVTRPFLYYVNRYDPFFIAAQQTAVSGRVAMVKYNTTGEIGKHALIGFRIAAASDIAGWKAAAVAGTAPTLTGISGSFIFSLRNPIQYQNELAQDIDIASIPTGFDYWRGTLSLIIVG
jgi:hypothetical protein